MSDDPPDSDQRGMTASAIVVNPPKSSSRANNVLPWPLRMPPNGHGQYCKLIVPE
ncbi:hypothetical protein KCP69_04390 [Salmonella enterica subsp. enterica]|nr:hypothetical protein KCP69_04390 [Salmonella enterica subsp. enterica]